MRCMSFSLSSLVYSRTQTLETITIYHLPGIRTYQANYVDFTFTKFTFILHSVGRFNIDVHEEGYDT